jgi:hypothetical protein
MTKEKAKDILSMLDGFAKLEHKSTDEVGWIQCKFSCTRARALRMVEQAREIAAKAEGK